MIKESIISCVVFLSFLLLTQNVFAHVVVKPAEVGVGAFQTFTVGVPNEKDIPTTEVRVIVPKGVEHVTPNVKPGWEISVGVGMKGEVLNTGEQAPLEIVWRGGVIPTGQRDEFLFSAKVPDSETTLKWQAYQTYEDGTVVAWDQDSTNAEHSEEGGSSGPLSTTHVINDLSEENVQESSDNKSENSSTKTISFLALAVAIVALGLSFRKK